MIDITHAEILEALVAAQARPGADGAQTTAELQVLAGVSDRRLRVALRQCATEGRLSVHRVQRMSLDGRLIMVPGYVISPKPKRKR